MRRYKSVRLDFNCPFPGIPINTSTFAEADGFTITREGDYITVARGGDSFEVHASRAVPMVAETAEDIKGYMAEMEKLLNEPAHEQPKRGGWPKGKPRKPQP